MHMVEDYKIRWFKEEDLSKYISGLNHTLYTEYNFARFKWKWIDSPSTLGFITIAVVEDPSGLPIAFNSFLPLNIRSGKDIIKVVQGCDGYVDPEYRRMGLFQKTISFMASELQNKGPEILLGFNFAGATGAATKAGSYATTSFQEWKLTEPNLNIDSNIIVERIDVEEYSKVYESWACSTRMLHLDRSLEYLKWRFNKAPRREYRLYKIKDQETIGCVAVSLGEDTEKTVDLTLEDYSPNLADHSIFSSTLKFIFEDFRGVDEILLTTGGGSPIERIVNNLGFKPTPRFTLIMKPIANVSEKEGKIYRNDMELTDISNWHITGSDIY
jgi:hypothetical protein